MPIFCSPTALQRLFHHDGERAVARAAEKFGTMFGVSSLGTVSVEEIGSMFKTPKMFQFYFHKDRASKNAMNARAKEALRTSGLAPHETIPLARPGSVRRRSRAAMLMPSPKLTTPDHHVAADAPLRWRERPRLHRLACLNHPA